MKSLFILIFSIFTLQLVAQNSQHNNPQDWLMRQREVFPQEKLYVMTDRDLYQPGDTVWMRVWVQDGITLRDSQIGSKYVYAELRDGMDQVLRIIQIRESEGGRFVGQMVLPNNLQSGNLTLIAYTHFMINTNEALLFKKELHVIKPSDWAKGYRPRSLYEEKVSADIIEPMPESPVTKFFGDTLTRISLNLPANTWYSVSVTDDALSPIDLESDIVTTLINTPNLFDSNTPHQPDQYFLPQGQPEKTIQVKGSVSPRKGQKASVYLINPITSSMFVTYPNEDGTFLFDNIDAPEGSFFCVFATDGTNDHKISVTVEPSYQDLSLSHLSGNARNYYVNISREKVQKPVYTDPNTDPEFVWLQQTLQRQVADSLRLHALETSPSSEKFGSFIHDVVASQYIPDDYARLADKTYNERDYPDVIDATLKNMLKRMSFIKFDADGFPMYKPKKGESIPIRFVVDDKEQPYEWNKQGQFIAPLILHHPLFLVKAIDFLSPESAAKLSYKFKDDNVLPIIRIELYKDINEVLYSGSHLVKWNIPVGYTKKLHFKNTIISRNLTPTRYWNPELYSGPTGNLTLDLPLPRNYSTTYTVRVEGVTPEGTLISEKRRIAMGL